MRRTLRPTHGTALATPPPRRPTALATTLIAAGTLALVVTGLMTSSASEAGAAQVAGQLCGEVDAVAVSGGAYTVQNNRYGVPDGQCVTARDGGFTVDQADGAIEPGGAPKSYPSLVAGCHWGRCSDAPGLPVRASAVGDARTAVSITRAPGSWNAAYDLWFNSTPDPQGQNDGTELMIWIDGEDAPDPIGEVVGAVTIAGATWDVWQGDMGWRVISFVHRQGTTSVDLPLEPFVREAVERGATEPGWWLTSVQFGFEPWSGGAGLAADGFSWTPPSGATPGAAVAPEDEGRSGVPPAEEPVTGAGDGGGANGGAALGDQAQSSAASPSVADGGAVVRHGASGRCLDARGSGQPGDPQVALWDCDATQTWTLSSIGDLIHEGTGACLGPAEGATTAGTPVQLQVCDRLAVQEWTRVDDELVHAASGLCLAAAADARQDGTSVVLSRCA